MLGARDPDIMTILRGGIARLLEFRRVLQRHQDVTAVPEVHYALRDVYSIAADVDAPIHVELSHNVPL